MKLTTALAIAKTAYEMRNLPKEIFGKMQHDAMLTLDSSQEVYRDMARWLSGLDVKTRNYGVVQRYNDDEDEWKHYIVPGKGTHNVEWRGVTMKVSRNPAEPENTFFNETMTITAPEDKAYILAELLDHVTVKVETKKEVRISTWRGGNYSLLDIKKQRRPESLFMNPGSGDLIIADALQFQNNRDWYDERSLPYRRGYLLDGPPGTGKSSFIFVLAGVLQKDVYIINLSTVLNDNDLQSAFNQAQSGIVAVEDIDATSNDKITDSGLLNAVDGIASRDGRILVITSNKPDMINPTLLRPGRIDKRVTFDPLQRDAAYRMYQTFFPGGHEFDDIPLPITGAALQNLLLEKYHAN